MENIKEPLVSIITPLYNSEKFIAETIESVLSQTYKNWEMIIVNDCSKDNGPNIVQEYQKKDKRIKLFNNEINQGVSFTRNKAINLAQGKYIAFLDSDDLWKKEKLEKQVKLMEENEFFLSYTGYNKMNEDGSERGIINVPKKLNYKELLKNNLISCDTGMYHRENFKDLRFKNLELNEDYVFWLEALKKVDYAYGVTEVLATYRVAQNSRSSNKINGIKFNWKIYRDIEKLTLLKSIYYYLIYIYRGIKRYLK